ncbi:MAG: pyrroline-5-carboxylate reductase [Nitrospina sp.]|nr:pyrroline-5-carboxylate reductase [Nitrospina sp.]
MLTKKKLGFVGGGNMAEAIVKGLLDSSLVASKDIFISDLISDRLEYLSKEYKVKTTDDNRELVKKSDILVLAVKPQTVKKVLESFSDLIDSNKNIISVAAGISISLIEDTLCAKSKKKISIIRTMPNTPSLVQEGATAICGSKHSSKLDIKIAHHIFKAIGQTVDIEEIHMDAVTGLSGSGPAYIFMIIEALSDAGVKVGLSREVSNTLTIQTILGSAKLARDGGKHPGQLKDMVTSPGGTTIPGLHMLEEGGIRKALMNAVEMATQRSKELGKNK